jgi:hypothetical protein
MRGGMVQPKELPKEYRQDILVLGRFPAYIDMADELGAHRFAIPTEVWNRMAPGQQWAANQRALDRAIARNAEIRLATPLSEVKDPNSSYARELGYMMTKGYRLSADGARLIRSEQVACPGCALTP